MKIRVNHRLCMCCCGGYVKDGSRSAFIPGHKKIWEANWSELCECGCGQVTTPGRRFITGHNANVRSEELIAQVANKNRGKKRSLEIRKKMSERQKGRPGRKKNEDEKRRISLTLTEQKGVSPEFHERHPYLKCVYDWKAIKKKVKRRDHYRCIACGNGLDSGLELHVHHVVPVEIGKTSRLCDRRSNLVTLCNSCHSKYEPSWSCNPGNDKLWRNLLPFAKTYLSQFGYKRLLLTSYLPEAV